MILGLEIIRTSKYFVIYYLVCIRILHGYYAYGNYPTFDGWIIRIHLYPEFWRNRQIFPDNISSWSLQRESRLKDGNSLGSKAEIFSPTGNKKSIDVTSELGKAVAKKLFAKNNTQFKTFITVILTKLNNLAAKTVTKFYKRQSYFCNLCKRVRTAMKTLNFE